MLLLLLLLTLENKAIFNTVNVPIPLGALLLEGGCAAVLVEHQGCHEGLALGPSGREWRRLQGERRGRRERGSRGGGGRSGGRGREVGARALLDPDVRGVCGGVEADAVAEGLRCRVVLLPGGVVRDVADLDDGVPCGEDGAGGEGDLVAELAPLALPELLRAALYLRDEEPHVPVVVLGVEVHQDVDEVVLDEDPLLVLGVLGALAETAASLEAPEG